MLQTLILYHSPDLFHESHTCTSNWLLYISMKVANRLSTNRYFRFNMSTIELLSFFPNLVSPPVFPNSSKERMLAVHLFRPSTWSNFSVSSHPPHPSASPVCSTFKVYPVSSLVSLFSQPSLGQRHHHPSPALWSSLLTRLPAPAPIPLQFST